MNNKSNNKITSFHESWNEFKANHYQKGSNDNYHNHKYHNDYHNEAQNMKMSEVLTSCPANVFKNYQSVFAEITKNVIGEIEESDSDA